jgi:nicotinamidase-related amidase
MQDQSKMTARRSIITEAMQKAALQAVLNGNSARTIDAEPRQYVEVTSAPSSTSAFALDLERTALVVIDPHAQFLRSTRADSSHADDSTADHGTVGNLGRMFKAAQHAGITVAVSVTAEGFKGSDVMPELKPYVEADTTIICSPHTRYSPLPPVNDSGLQLRRERVRQIVLAGLIANLRLESHLRDFLEQGFEVAVVRDAISGPLLPEGDGYLSALINFRRLANALLTTDQVLAAFARGESLSELTATECGR